MFSVLYWLVILRHFNKNSTTTLHQPKRDCTFFFNLWFSTYSLYSERKCRYVSFVILQKNVLKFFSPRTPTPLWGSKFWGNDQNCLLGPYSCQWHHFEPNPSTQSCSTVCRIFLKIWKMQLMRFVVHLLSFSFTVWVYHYCSLIRLVAIVLSYHYESIISIVTINTTYLSVPFLDIMPTKISAISCMLMTCNFHEYQ